MAGNQRTKSELLIGCGSNHKKLMWQQGGSREWSNLTTLDINDELKPTVVHDLEQLPYPFLTDSFDELHAYDVLEHTGTQGDYEFFFRQFNEFHRILRPDGLLFAKVPNDHNVWTWGDPGHKRVINHGTIAFLVQANYGVPPMTDYRHIYHGDFEVVVSQEDEFSFYFMLKAKK